MGRIYKGLTVSNNGKEAEIVAFVDTGSDGCIISEDIANYLKIKKIKEEEIIVANKEIIKAYVGRVTVVSKMDKIKDEVVVNITDAPFEVEPEENIDMIIGVDFLQEHNVKLSFKKPKKKG